MIDCDAKLSTNRMTFEYNKDMLQITLAKHEFPNKTVRYSLSRSF